MEIGAHIIAAILGAVVTFCVLTLIAACRVSGTISQMEREMYGEECDRDINWEVVSE